jgi:hypothetical protein
LITMRVELKHHTIEDRLRQFVRDWSDRTPV